MPFKFPIRLALIASATTIAACGGGSSPPVTIVAEEARQHDSRVDFAVSAADAVATTFAAMSKQTGDAVDVTTTSRWVGVLGTSGYRVEVPANWNGRLGQALTQHLAHRGVQNQQRAMQARPSPN